MARNAGSGRQRETKQSRQEEDTAPEHQGSEDLQERQDQLDEDVDDILDDIDEVLEENAEEFVRGFVQKGGQ